MQSENMDTQHGEPEGRAIDPVDSLYDKYNQLLRRQNVPNYLARLCTQQLRTAHESAADPAIVREKLSIDIETQNAALDTICAQCVPDLSCPVTYELPACPTKDRCSTILQAQADGTLAIYVQHSKHSNVPDLKTINTNAMALVYRTFSAANTLMNYVAKTANWRGDAAPLGGEPTSSIAPPSGDP